jgi:16S rRNA (guanine527-N7)-methyltransferase
VSPRDFEESLQNGIAKLGLVMPSGAAARLMELTRMLGKWNAVHNLTGIHAPVDMVSKHLLDSLTAVPFIRSERVLDVGTGAGFPGIPLAIVLPERRFTLLDSNGKKARFVTQAVASLGLENVDVEQVRAESYHPAEPFVTVISRAFASLAKFLQHTDSCCARDGRWLAMKGAPPDDELRKLPAGFLLAAVHPVTVPGLAARRCIVELKRQTPRAAAGVGP